MTKVGNEGVAQGEGKCGGQYKNLGGDHQMTGCGLEREDNGRNENVRRAICRQQEHDFQNIFIRVKSEELL